MKRQRDQQAESIRRLFEDVTAVESPVKEFTDSQFETEQERDAGMCLSMVVSSIQQELTKSAPTVGLFVGCWNQALGRKILVPLSQREIVDSCSRNPTSARRHRIGGKTIC